MTTFGIDVSHYQGGMDMAAAFSGGVQFVIAKLSDGDSWRDANFSGFNSDVKENQGLFAAYHWLRSTSKPADQAENAFNALPDHTIPLILDVEPVISSGKYVSRPTWDHVEAFLSAYDGTRAPLIYLPAWYWAEIGKPDLGTWTMWSSSYGTNPVGTFSSLYPGDQDGRWSLYDKPRTGILQFASQGRVNGYSKDVDLDAYRGTRDELAATGWFKDYRIEAEVTPEDIQKAVATAPIRIDAAGNTQPLQLVLRRLLNAAATDADETAKKVVAAIQEAAQQAGDVSGLSETDIEHAVANVLRQGVQATP